MRIGFLGLGKMGSAMAHRLITAGHELAVWNRTEGKTEPLAREGAIVAGTPAEAELGADAVITMLFDDYAHEEVLFGPNGLMDALTPGTLHISCSTISVALSERLTQEHARRGIPFIAAPVFGRPNVAEAGKLWIVVAGSDENITRARPILEAMSRGISVVGSEPWQAHALKLGGNFLISTMIQSLSEAFVYAESQGIEPGVFLEAVNSALFQSPFYASYGNVMLAPAGASRRNHRPGRKGHTPAARGGGGTKNPAQSGRQPGGIFEEAKQAGLANEDWAVGQYQIAQKRGKAGIKQ